MTKKDSTTEIYQIYGGAVTLNYEDGRHRYYVTDKEQKMEHQLVPGCTTILGVINKPALMGWAVKMAGEYINENLKPGVALDEVEIKDLIQGAKGAHRKKRDSAADLGTMIHEWIEQYIKAEMGIKGYEKPEDPTNEKMQSAIVAFFDWRKKHKVVFTHSEQKVYSRMVQVAGTIDAIGTIDGKTSIIDFKTSNGIWPEMTLQVAFYQQAWEEMTGAKIDKRWLIRFGKEDGEFEAVEFTDHMEDAKAFGAANTLYKRLKQIEKL